MSDTRKLLSNSSLLFAATVVSGAFSYIFNTLMGRWLGPSEYGQLSALLSILAIMFIFGTVIQVVGTRYTSEFLHSDRVGGVAGIHTLLSRTAVFTAAVVAVAGSAVIIPLRHSLKIDSVPAILITMFGLLFAFLLAVNRGVLQGAQRFPAVAGTNVMEMFARLAIGIVMVKLGFGLKGAIGGVVAAGFAAYLLSAPLIASLIRKSKGEHVELNRKDILQYVIPTFVASVIITILLNSDILIAKYFFPAEEAGLYAAISTVAKIINYATGPIVAVMFPMIAEKKTSGEKHYKMLILSLALTLVVGVGFITLYTLVPGTIMRVLYGTAYAGYYQLLPQVGIYILLSSLVFLFVNYYLAIKDYLFLWFMMFVPFIQVIWVAMAHSTLEIMVRILVATTFGLVVLFVLRYLYTKRVQLRELLRV